MSSAIESLKTLSKDPQAQALAGAREGPTSTGPTQMGLLSRKEFKYEWMVLARNLTRLIDREAQVFQFYECYFLALVFLIGSKTIL